MGSGSNPGSTTHQLYDCGQIPRDAPASGFPLCKMGMTIVSTSWSFHED